MYRDKDTGKVYTKWQIFKKWFALDDDVLEDFEAKGIVTFEDWLSYATNLSGSLEYIPNKVI